MSLINDALKRAQEAQRPDKPASASSIRTIEVRDRSQPYTNRILVIVIFVLLAAAVAFIGLAMTGRLVVKKNMAAQTPAPPVAAPQPAPAAVATAPIAPVQPAPTPVAPTPVPAVALAPLILPDSLHVQGVAYDPVRPWAIVSGKMVYLGDVVKGVRIAEIGRNFVVFSNGGQTNRLFVGQ